MLERIRTATERKDQGFTLIELLVVMIIIGILAAIAIPVFMNQQVKARESAAKADVSNIGKEIATYFVDHAPVTAGLPVDDTPATTTEPGKWALTGATPAVGGNLSGDNAAAGLAISGSDFCVAVWSVQDVPTSGTNTHVWRYTENGLSKGTCTGANPAT